LGKHHYARGGERHEYSPGGGTLGKDLNNNNSNNGDEKENHTHGDEPWLWRLYGFGTTKAAKTLTNYNDNRYIILLQRRHPTLFGCIRRRQPSVSE